MEQIEPEHFCRWIPTLTGLSLLFLEAADNPDTALEAYVTTTASLSVLHRRLLDDIERLGKHKADAETSLPADNPTRRKVESLFQSSLETRKSLVFALGEMESIMVRKHYISPPGNC
jgi:hypothetical protein